ncbi:uncharacterized protein LOC144737649 isoform X5 [Lampetra planeri]
MSHRGDTRSGDAAGGDVEQEQKEEVEEEVAAVRPTEPSVSGGDVERRWSETCVQVKVERQEEDDDDKSYGGVPVPVVPSPSSPCSSRRHRSGPWPRQGTGGCLDHAWGRDAAGSPETAAVGMSWVCGIAGIAVRRRPGAFSRGENLSAALGFRPPGFHSLRRDLRPLRTEQRPLGGDDDDEPPRTVIANEGPLGPEAPTAAPMTARPRSFRCRDCGEDAAGGASRPDDRREAHVKKPGHSHHWRRCPACERASGAGPSHVCPACGKSFVRAAHLKIHVMTHTGEKPHVCPICGKAFTQTPHLKIHMMTHTGEKPNGCRLCGKGFICPSKLRIHMRTHTGERPHVCPVCSNGFTQSSVLKSHMLTHTGERPHRCAVCGHGFTQSSYLKSHMRTHTGDKPHPCAVCGKRFICPSKAVDHERLRGRSKPQVGIFCFGYFTPTWHLIVCELTFKLVVSAAVTKASDFIICPAAFERRCSLPQERERDQPQRTSESIRPFAHARRVSCCPRFLLDTGPSHNLTRAIRTQWYRNFADCKTAAVDVFKFIKLVLFAAEPAGHQLLTRGPTQTDHYSLPKMTYHSMRSHVTRVRFLPQINHDSSLIFLCSINHHRAKPAATRVSCCPRSLLDTGLPISFKTTASYKATS